MGFLQFLSYAFGWIYTLCWSLSFYPQPILNARRKTTAGSVVDFPFVNTLGKSQPRLVYPGVYPRSPPGPAF